MSHPSFHCSVRSSKLPDSIPVSARSPSCTGIAQSKVADGNYISLGAEMGWLGLAMLGTVLLSALWVLVRHARAPADPATRALGLGLTGYLVAMAVHAVSANVFECFRNSD